MFFGYVETISHTCGFNAGRVRVIMSTRLGASGAQGVDSQTSKG